MHEQLIIGFITSLSGRWPRELPKSRQKEYGVWLRENVGDAKVVEFGALVDELVEGVLSVGAGFAPDDCTGLIGDPFATAVDNSLCSFFLA